MAYGVETRILRECEKLDISFSVSSLEPRQHLPVFAQARVDGRDVLRRNIWSRAQIVHNPKRGAPIP